MFSWIELKDCKFLIMKTSGGGGGGQCAATYNLCKRSQSSSDALTFTHTYVN